MKKDKFFLAKVFNILITIIQILIGLYIVLKLFGATEVPFVHWIYALNAPLLAPFNGIFKSIEFKHLYVLDLSAIFALIIYSIVGYILIKLSFMIEGKK